MNSPAATVIVLTYRQQEYVEDALRSVFSQDCGDFEVIIADDASPDGTVEAIRRTLGALRPDIPCRLLTAELNLGVTANWNRAVEASRGEIIIAAAGDDLMCPCRVRRSLEFFRDNPHCQALSGNCRTIDENGTTIRDPWRYRQGVATRSLGSGPLWKGFGFIGATAAYRAGTLRAFGPLDRRCGSEDTPGVVRGQLAGSASVLPEVLVSWRRHPDSLSYSSSGRAGWLAKLRKARGAYRDAVQIRKDILRAVELSMRTAEEVKGAKREAALMYHQNRIKYHLLHPRRRSAVVLGMVRTLWRDKDIPFLPRLALAAKRLLGLLRPKRVISA